MDVLYITQEQADIGNILIAIVNKAVFNRPCLHKFRHSYTNPKLKLQLDSVLIGTPATLYE